MEHKTILGVFLHCGLVPELFCHWALRSVGRGICKWNVTNPFPVKSNFRNDGNASEGQQRGGSAGLDVSSHDGMVTSAAGQLSSLQGQSESHLVNLWAISVWMKRGCLNGARSGISVKGCSFLDLLSLAWLDLIFTRLQTGFCWTFVYLVIFFFFCHFTLGELHSFKLLCGHAEFISSFSVPQASGAAPSVSSAALIPATIQPHSALPGGAQGFQVPKWNQGEYWHFFPFSWVFSIAGSKDFIIRMRIPGCFLWLFGILRFSSHGS